jgi:hypothetical protein
MCSNVDVEINFISKKLIDSGRDIQITCYENSLCCGQDCMEAVSQKGGANTTNHGRSSRFPRSEI